jgi:hypothetical protein
MSKLIFSSSRPNAGLEIRHQRREGSLVGVAIILNGTLVEMVQPEGFNALVAWLRKEANALEARAQATGNEEG